MELIGKLKNEVDQATSKEEARELIEKAGMKLTDEELDKVKLKDDDLEKVSGGFCGICTALLHRARYLPGSLSETGVDSPT